MSDLLPALKKLGKADLVQLVEDMLEQEPGLLALVEASLPIGKGKKGHALVAEFRKKARQTLNNAGTEWRAARKAAANLRKLLPAGAGYLDAGKVLSAVAVYQGVGEAVLDGMERLHDEPGDLSMVVSDCVKGLGRCLSGGLKQGNRWEVLRFLFDVCKRDFDQGGTGLGDAARELLAELKGKEREALADWVREALKGARREWSVGAYGGWLLDLEGDQLDDETYLARCREYGLERAVVERLLERGRVDEAEKEALAANEYRLLGLADLFVEKGHAARAKAMVLERSRTSSDGRLREWLQKRTKARL